MEKIPTAEEFMLSNRISNPVGEVFRLNLSRDCHAKTEKDIQQAMIEFAKLHVEAALKEASEKATVTPVDHEEISEGSFRPIWGVDDDSILNSYSLDNIK